MVTVSVEQVCVGWWPLGAAEKVIASFDWVVRTANVRTAKAASSGDARSSVGTKGRSG